ncbi:Ribokinase-like protein [Apiosordaria backusii]|uniref:pyridoxal kinase n=1 Tax=Apiosordaria backusii TaxID=314023 RepID=A0AA40B7T3_9PEZI|nr:Ribokinase-like protein [Apiosordaria backusii]
MATFSLSARHSPTSLSGHADKQNERYVGNKIASFTMQALGCDVAALNTVDFSNHTGYGQWTGTRATPSHILSLWSGLKQSSLDDFDMMLSGYVPGAAALEAVGQIAQELKDKSQVEAKREGQGNEEGNFFWVLDPVMGDNGNLYVGAEVVPVYRGLVGRAEMVLPNQFEAELLSEVKIVDMESLGKAIEVLHERYGVPHVVITSVSLPQPPPDDNNSDLVDGDTSQGKKTLSVIGSSMTSFRKPRPFRISFPAIDCYFSGTGDMFAALMVVRMREAVCIASATTEPGLERKKSWLSGDGVEAVELPLARAAEKVLGKEGGEGRMGNGDGNGEGVGVVDKKRMQVLKSKAAELKLVRYLDSLREPKVVFRARGM